MSKDDETIDGILRAYAEDTRRELDEAENAGRALAEILIVENMSVSTEEW